MTNSWSNYKKGGISSFQFIPLSPFCLRLSAVSAFKYLICESYVHFNLTFILTGRIQLNFKFIFFVERAYHTDLPLGHRVSYNCCAMPPNKVGVPSRRMSIVLLCKICNNIWDITSFMKSLYIFIYMNIDKYILG